MEDAGGMTSFIRRILPAIALLFLSPLVAEFLLGDFPLSKIGLLLILAPFYGGGAILIREIARRTGRGWPTILTLALAFGILEEAFTTQSLFNPNYLGLSFHLLAPAFIPALGIGGWWTIFVLTLHTVWSISVPIAIVEALVPLRAHVPWLRSLGLILVTFMFAGTGWMMTLYAIRHDKHHFIASRAQFAVSALCCVVIAGVAMLLPRPGKSRRPGFTPSPWFTGGISLVASSIFLLVLPTWAWAAVAIYLVLDGLVIAAVLSWSRLQGWNGLHVLSLAGGAALSYAWHAFIAKPVMGKADLATRIGNAILAAFTIALLYAAARRTSAALRDVQTQLPMHA